MTGSRQTEAERLRAAIPPFLRLPPSEANTSASAEMATRDRDNNTADDADNEQDDNFLGTESASNALANTPSSGLFSQESSSRWVNSILGAPPPLRPPTGEGAPNLSELQHMEFVQHSLANALASVNSEKIPVRTPDRFDGSKPEKLDIFEGQCRMVFLGDEKRYNSAKKKALYAGSYLDGAAADWWLQELRKTDAGFGVTADSFWDILRERFGNPDHIRIVERQLTQPAAAAQFLQMLS